MTDIHSCHDGCLLPSCVSAARQQLRDREFEVRDLYAAFKELEAERDALKADRDALKQSINRFHHIMHKAKLHPGRTDDDLLEILERHLTERSDAREKT
jgi:outer membrane murein-binding lipoprotein Lpp